MSSTTPSDTILDKTVAPRTLTNWADRVLSERGFISSEEVRISQVDNALVDTEATRLCLPTDIIQKLELKQSGTIDAHTATGIHPVQVYEGLELTVEGRTGRYSCLELPAGKTPLLG